MFTTARYYIKTALLFFIIGILTGVYLYAAQIFYLPVTYTLKAAHTHILLVGGMLMMILGVAVWFFPRPTKEDNRYKPVIVWSVYWVFTSATIFRFISEIFEGIFIGGLFKYIAFTSSLLQVAAVIVLIFSLWGRIRSVGSHLREKKGERF